jgi:hypothetical protein
MQMALINTEAILCVCTFSCQWYSFQVQPHCLQVESSWNVMAHGDAWEVKWSGNWQIEWVASTIHTTKEHVVSSITFVDAHNSAASSRLNWRCYWFKWSRLFHWKMIPGFCACTITFQTQSTTLIWVYFNKQNLSEHLAHKQKLLWKGCKGNLRQWLGEAQLTLYNNN